MNVPSGSEAVLDFRCTSSLAYSIPTGTLIWDIFCKSFKVQDLERTVKGLLSTRLQDKQESCAPWPVTLTGSYSVGTADDSILSSTTLHFVELRSKVCNAAEFFPPEAARGVLQGSPRYSTRYEQGDHTSRLRNPGAAVRCETSWIEETNTHIYYSWPIS